MGMVLHARFCPCGSYHIELYGDTFESSCKKCNLKYKVKLLLDQTIIEVEALNPKAEQ